MTVRKIISTAFTIRNSFNNLSNGPKLFLKSDNFSNTYSALYYSQFAHRRISNNLEITLPNGYDNGKEPMVILLSWLLSQRKQWQKYADIYLNKGYSVLTVSIRPAQIIWPLTGSQVIASELLQYLNTNNIDSPLLLHGFSVGGYVWGETLVKLTKNMDKYKHIVDRVVGQTWDSAADITEIPKGLPFATFPNNKIVRSALEHYLGFHMKFFFENATKHYLLASQQFHNTPIHAPALIFVCDSDLIGSSKSNAKVKESWESMGMQVRWKCWKESKHVAHMLYHRDDYLGTLESFLTSLKLPPQSPPPTDESNLQFAL